MKVGFINDSKITIPTKSNFFLFKNEEELNKFKERGKNFDIVITIYEVI